MLVRLFASLRIVILEPVLSVGWFASASDIVTHACSVAVSQRVFPNQQSGLLLRTYIEKHWRQIRMCSFYILQLAANQSVLFLHLAANQSVLYLQLAANQSVLLLHLAANQAAAKMSTLSHTERFCSSC